jgi:steroid delta-isomerase-like uncharacterized protein
MSTEMNKTAVRRWVEAAWNNEDFSSAEGLYSPNYTLHYGSMPPTQGAEGLQSFVMVYRTALPDLHMQIEDIIAEGDKVVWRITTRGTHRGEFQGIPPTGKSVEVGAIIISRFADGRWAEDWVNNDDLGLLQQLGVIPVMGQAPAMA